jgi:hypothetical protein
MRPTLRQGHVPAWVSAVSKRYGNRIGDKWQQALSLVRGKFNAKATIQNDCGSVFGVQMGLKEWHAPAIHDNVVVLERAWEVDAEALLKGLALMYLGH